MADDKKDPKPEPVKPAATLADPPKSEPAQPAPQPVYVVPQPPPAPPDGEAKKHDETTPGGAYISGGVVRGGKHYGGVVRNADGVVLAEFDDQEVNPGKDWKPPAKADKK